MKTSGMGRLVLVAGLLGVLVLGPSSAIVYAAAYPAGPDFTKIDAYVRDEMAASPIPGLALGVVQRDQIVHMQGFGVAGPDGKPVTPQTPFRIASVGKSFTALAIRQLINSGRVDEGALVQRYLPWFRMADPQASAQITVRHLLHHASGIPGDAVAAIEFDDSYTTEQMVRTLDKVALDRPVGSSYEYANANFLILGLIVEAASGQSYVEYVQQHIFTPLQMQHSYMSEAAALRDGLARGHQPWFGFVVSVHEPFVTGMLPAGGAAVSSAEDMARFVTLYLNDGWYGDRSIVGPAPAGSDSNYDLYWNPGEGIQFGYIGQEGASISYSSGLYLGPEQGWGVIVLTNSRLEYIGAGEGTSGGNIAEGVMRVLIGQSPAAPSDLGFRQAVLLMDLGIVLLILFLGIQVVRLRRWRNLVLPIARRKRAVLLRVILPVAVDLGLAMAALFGLPFLNGTPWSYLIYVMPDLSYTLIGAGVILLGLAAAKAVLGYRALRLQHPGDMNALPAVASPTSPSVPIPPATRSV